MKNILVIILISIIFCACTSTKYVEVPVPQIRTEYRDRTLRDTVYNSDSIIIKEHGDTVFLERYKYIYKTKNITDTVIVTDTITTIKTVEVTKEINKLNNWQLVLITIGIISIIILLRKIFKR